MSTGLANLRARGALRTILVGIALASAAPAGATVLSGEIRVIDGDTFAIADRPVRLWGIDAPDRDQLCWLAGEPWACGEAAASALEQLIGGSKLFCIGVDVDSAGVVHAFCRSERASVNASMVRSGWALDDRRRSGGVYAGAQAEAKAKGFGLWAGEFDLPWQWRNEVAPALITIALVVAMPPGAARRLGEARLVGGDAIEVAGELPVGQPARRPAACVGPARPANLFDRISCQANQPMMYSIWGEFDGV